MTPPSRPGAGDDPAETARRMRAIAAGLTAADVPHVAPAPPPAATISRPR